MERAERGLLHHTGGRWVTDVENVLSELEVRILGKLRITHDGRWRELKMEKVKADGKANPVEDKESFG